MLLVRGVQMLYYESVARLCFFEVRQPIGRGLTCGA